MCIVNLRRLCRLATGQLQFCETKNISANGSKRAHCGLNYSLHYSPAFRALQTKPFFSHYLLRSDKDIRCCSAEVGACLKVAKDFHLVTPTSTQNPRDKRMSPFHFPVKRYQQEQPECRDHLEKAHMERQFIQTTLP